MTAATCPVCLAQQDAGLLCSSCCDRLERELGDVAAIVGELDVTLSKQARIGTPGKSGLARERIPINVGAMQAADNLGNVLTTWARDVGTEWWSFRRPAARSVIAAGYLLGEINAIRRHPAVVELVDEITDAVAQARRAVDRPADRVFVGPCMSEQPDDEGRLVTCLEDLYAREGAGTVRCKVCTWEHDVAERRQWLLDRAADRLFTVREAAQMMGDVGGIRVTESSIRGYIHRASNPLNYRAGTKLIRLGDLLTVVLDESERKGAA
jgi:hypothetical protein